HALQILAGPSLMVAVLGLQMLKKQLSGLHKSEIWNHIWKFLSKAEARDKLGRVVQYFCRFLQGALVHAPASPLQPYKAVIAEVQTTSAWATTTTLTATTTTTTTCKVGVGSTDSPLGKDDAPHPSPRPGCKQRRCLGGSSKSDSDHLLDPGPHLLAAEGWNSEVRELLRGAVAPAQPQVHHAFP
ncbi:unnamed protein product, partial [Polarella glacialis]